jgi:ribosomal protein S18 acetylase RimI-like enzyme
MARRYRESGGARDHQTEEDDRDDIVESCTLADQNPDYLRPGAGYRRPDARLQHRSGQSLGLARPTGVDDDALMAIFQRTVPEENLPQFFGTFEQMGAYHPSEPHWYLPLIGVDPARQGGGFGSRLLAHALAQCDRDGTPAYLESSNPANIPLYQRHGFEVLGAIQQPGTPRITPMLRKPRS